MTFKDLENKYLIYNPDKVDLDFWKWLHTIFKANLGKTDDEIKTITWHILNDNN